MTGRRVDRPGTERRRLGLRRTSSRETAVALAWTLVCLFTSQPAWAAGESYLLIVSGLGGEADYRDRFYTWAVTLQEAAGKRLGIPEDRIWYLAEDPERDPDRIDGKSTKDNIIRVAEEIARRARPGDQVFVLLIGHGSFRSGESRFNLAGPDMTPDEFAVLLGRFSAQEVVFVNTTSASGDFVKALSGENHIIVTATKTGLERNETVFGGYFVQALAEDVADVNKDDRVSVLEAFDYARLQVARFYEEGNRLQTEHALLDDNGDGLGTHAVGEAANGGDGRLAASAFLSGARGVATAGATDDPELVGLYEQARGLEGRIEDLKRRKDTMSPELYLEELEKLLVELAEKRKAIRQLEQRVKGQTQP